jgi:hypothetical protein
MVETEIKMLDLSYIYKSFQELDNINDKIAYLQSLEKLNHNYDFNIKNLITAWEQLGKKLEAEAEQ